MRPTRTGTKTTDTMTFDTVAPPPEEPTEEIVRGEAEGERYTDLGLVAIGGMGEVRRVMDHALRRVLVMKIIREDLRRSRSAVARFVEEAQATAQLEHPGIVPVHETGVLPDGRRYFTMKEVRGRTLAQLIGEVRAGVGEVTVRRLVDVFLRICEAVAYAHARGMVHRDLKPENVMVGAFGEVLVLDWGLAKVVAHREEPCETFVVTDRSADASMRTRFGTVAGTPRYMSPEQAAGQLDRIDARSDVYALGVLLEEILSGDDGAIVRDAPEPLVWLAARARAPDRDRRPVDAGAIGAEVAAWLEGTRRHRDAMELVERARAMLPEVDRRLADVARLRGRAREALDELASHAPIEAKRPFWALQDEAAQVERDVALQQVEAMQLLRAALAQVPDLAPAHELLADLHMARLAESESRGDAAGAARQEAFLRVHALPRHEAFLRGNGALTLVTDPPARATLHRYVERDRHRVAELVEVVETPLLARELPHGSYLVVLEAPGCGPVRYAARIARLSHWDGVPPGSSSPEPIRLVGGVGDAVVVPAGWTTVGGDPGSFGAMPHRTLWVDAFAIGRFPVTWAEYGRFLDALSEAGRVDEMMRHAPRTEPSPGGVHLFPLRDGRFVITEPLDLPAHHVDWFGAVAYADWLAQATGQPWRLPGEVEWEKAARGVDERFFPFGNHVDGNFCCFAGSHADYPRCRPVASFPIDESPYGVRGLAGNVRDWLECPYLRNGHAVVDGRIPRVVDRRPELARIQRGGCYGFHEQHARAATRWWQQPDWRHEGAGFRVARTL